MQNASQALANTQKKQEWRKGNPLKAWPKRRRPEKTIPAMEKTSSSSSRQLIRQEIEPEKAEKTVQNGYFEDADVKDRTLSDYAGNWQSVYPIWSGTKTNQDYKAYCHGMIIIN